MISSRRARPRGRARARLLVCIAVVVAAGGCAAPERSEGGSIGGTARGQGGDPPPEESSTPDVRADGDEDEPPNSDGDGDEPGGGPGAAPRARVTDVVDGDTIEVMYRGRVLDVRLIGIDTPETVHPFEPVECGGPRASSFTKAELEGAGVRLAFDVERRDRYGRTLAYVFVHGRLFNEVLVARGFARVTTYPPNVRYVDRFLAAQRRARAGDRGLWGSCSQGGSSGEGSSAGGPPGGGSSGACDANYKGACIGDYPPDLDCAEVAASGFRSVGSDPHGFDGDDDGIACE